MNSSSMGAISVESKIIDLIISSISVFGRRGGRGIPQSSHDSYAVLFDIDSAVRKCTGLRVSVKKMGNKRP